MTIPTHEVPDRVDAIVLAAMEAEALPFIEQAQTVGAPRRYGIAEHRDLWLNGLHLTLVTTGIGLVNAALATSEALLAHSDRRAGERAPLVVSTGTAGGLGADVRVGDVVIGASYANADADARAFGYSIGQTPGMPARYSLDDATLAALPPDAANDDAPADFAVRRGLIVSSDAFISGTLAAGVRERFPEVSAADMESAAIAQSCHVYSVPFVSVRGISDLADPEAVDEHRAQVTDVSGRAARVTLEILSSLRSH